MDLELLSDPAAFLEAAGDHLAATRCWPPSSRPWPRGPSREIARPRRDSTDAARTVVVAAATTRRRGRGGHADGAARRPAGVPPPDAGRGGPAAGRAPCTSAARTWRRSTARLPGAPTSSAADGGPDCAAPPASPRAGSGGTAVPARCPGRCGGRRRRPGLCRWFRRSTSTRTSRPGGSRGGRASSRSATTTCCAASGGRVWLWEDGGEVVHLTGANAAGSAWLRIGPVFTPRERRGRGYASAAVAS